MANSDQDIIAGHIVAYKLARGWKVYHAQEDGRTEELLSVTFASDVPNKDQRSTMLVVVGSLMLKYPHHLEEPKT